MLVIFSKLSKDQHKSKKEKIYWEKKMVNLNEYKRKVTDRELSLSPSLTSYFYYYGI